MRALRLDDVPGGHQCGEQEDRHQRQTHPDLVGDHLGARAQTTEQRVGRVRRPAAEHDAVDADRGDRHHVQHRHRQVGELQPGVGVSEGDLHRRPERDHREGQEGRDRHDHRRRDVDEPVHALRHQVFLEHQLHTVGERLEQTERAVHVRSDPVLHPGHDPALPPDVEQRQHDQEDEDDQDLEDNDPPGIVADSGVRHGERPCHQGDGAHAFPPAIVTIEPWSACSDLLTCESAELVGSQTTLSVIGVISTGSRIELAVGAHHEFVTVVHTDPVRRGQRDPRHRAAGGRDQVRLTVVAAAVVDQHPPGRQPGRVEGAQRRVGLVRRLAGPVAVPAAELVELLLGGGRGAEPERGVHLLRQRGERPDVGHRGGHLEHRRERPLATLPVHEGAVLLRRMEPPGR